MEPKEGICGRFSASCKWFYSFMIIPSVPYSTPRRYLNIASYCHCSYVWSQIDELNFPQILVKFKLRCPDCFGVSFNWRRYSQFHGRRRPRGRLFRFHESGNLHFHRHLPARIAAWIWRFRYFHRQRNGLPKSTRPQPHLWAYGFSRILFRYREFPVVGILKYGGWNGGIYGWTPP